MSPYATYTMAQVSAPRITSASAKSMHHFATKFVQFRLDTSCSDDVASIWGFVVERSGVSPVDED